MVTRRQAADSCRQYLKIYGFRVSISPKRPPTNTADGCALCEFTVMRNGRTYGEGISLDDLIAFTRRFVPECCLSGIVQGADDFGEMTAEPAKKISGGQLLKKGIEMLRAVQQQL